MKHENLRRFEAIKRVVKKRRYRGAPWWKLQRYVLSQRTRENSTFNTILDCYAEQLSEECDET